MFQLGLLTVHYTHHSMSFLAEGLTKCKEALSLGEKIQGWIFLKPPLRWRTEPRRCRPHKLPSTPPGESEFSRESRKALCHKSGLCSGDEEPGFPKPSARSTRTGQTPASLWASTLTTLLRLACISPLSRLAKAGKDFGFFFPPQQKAYLPGPKSHTVKAALTSAVSELFYLKSSWAYTSLFIFSGKTPERADHSKTQHPVNQEGLSLLGIGSTTMV